MSDFDREIARVAARQHSLVTAADIAKAGGTAKHIQGRIASGRWVKVGNCYRVLGHEVTWPGHVLEAVLSGGDGAVASHRTAAALWGIDGFRPGRPEITIPRGRKFRRSDVRVHTSTDLDRTTPRAVNGVPLTDPARTMLDVARFVSDTRLLRSVESARRAGLVTWTELIETLRRHARRGRPGIRRLRRVIASGAHRDEITDSEFEILVIVLLLEHGFDEPVLHHRVLDGDRLVAEVDLAYPRQKVAMELDGAVHREAEVWERDHEKGNELRLLGWTVLRYTWRMYRDQPDRIVRELRAALRQAG